MSYYMPNDDPCEKAKRKQQTHALFWWIVLVLDVGAVITWLWLAVLR